MRALSLSYRSIFLAIGVIGLMLSGCGSDGKDGATGAQGPEGPPGPSYGIATSIKITDVSVTIPENHKPVVNFRVQNQNGQPFAGLAEGDLRFTIAKLTAGNPSVWQSYIYRDRGRNQMEAYLERYNNSQVGWGTWVNHGDGTYTYTFFTDLTNANCPSPCTEADGVTPLDLSYDPGKTHRLGIQLSNEDYGRYNFTQDFVPVPDPNVVVAARDIVKIENCNECHNQLNFHGGGRIDTKLCVMCHNPGSWIEAARNPGPVNETVDFKQMIHKLHYSGDDIVENPGLHQPDYLGEDIHFPQDIRNCAKCHTDSDSDPNRNAPQGNQWMTQPSMEACGACHDDIYFSDSTRDPARTWQDTAHPGEGKPPIIPVGNGACANCHIPSEVASEHSYPVNLKAEGAKYQLNIESVTSTLPTESPVITFSVSDPTNGDTKYDIAATPAIVGGSLNLRISWHAPNPGGIALVDFNNRDGTTSPNPISIGLLSGGMLAGTVTDNGNQTYTVTSPTAIPATATGTGQVGFYGRMSVDVDGNGTDDEVPVKSSVESFLITGADIVPRRKVVDIDRCDKCHSVLTLHGDNRTDEPQLCVMCHNPNNTDIEDRPTEAPTNTDDGKVEEAVDFKRMIHAIHAESIRTTDFVVFGYPGAGNVIGSSDCSTVPYSCQHNFAEVKFPGILSDCHTCHSEDPDTMTLEDRSSDGGADWTQPTQGGVLATTTSTGGLPGSTTDTNPDNDLNTSPTAAVCNSCHDEEVTKAHMEDLGSGLFDQLQDTTINGNYEQCVVCHGEGALADVEVVHEEATAEEKGLVSP